MMRTRARECPQSGASHPLDDPQGMLAVPELTRGAQDVLSGLLFSEPLDGHEGYLATLDRQLARVFDNVVVV